MLLGRLAWLLPLITAGAIALQAVLLIESRTLTVLSGVVIALLDAALFWVVLGLARSLRRDEPLSLHWVLFGMFLLSPLSGLLLPRGTSAILGLVGFVLTAWAWTRQGCRPKEPGLRRVMAVALLGGMALWAALLAFGLTAVRNAVEIRSLAAVGLALPAFFYILHVSRRLRDYVRLSDGMLLLGCFVVLPAVYTGPFLVLGHPEAILPCATVGLYYAIFAFVATAMAWSKGEKPGEARLKDHGRPCVEATLAGKPAEPASQ